jgi:mannose-6-phosphate isomerase-like protein (cupin superfamily)
MKKSVHLGSRRRFLWLLVDPAPPPRVVRCHERRVTVRPDGVLLEEVDRGLARSLRIVEASGPPGGRSALTTDHGEEHHLVLEGRLRLRQGSFVADLEPGDHLVWDGCVPHEAENIVDGVARLLIVTPGPDGVSLPERRVDIDEAAT